MIYFQYVLGLFLNGNFFNIPYFFFFFVLVSLETSWQGEVSWVISKLWIIIFILLWKGPSSSLLQKLLEPQVVLLKWMEYLQDSTDQSFFCCFVCLAFESGPMNLCSLINFIAYNNWLSTEKLLEWNGRPFYDLVNWQRRKSFQPRNGQKKARGRHTFKRATGAESDLDWIGIWIWNDIELMEYIQMWSS